MCVRGTHWSGDGRRSALSNDVIATAAPKRPKGVSFGGSRHNGIIQGYLLGFTQYILRLVCR